MLKHIPVMLEEVINILNIEPNGTYVDLTLGRGGHAKRILENLKEGTLIAFDTDKTALEETEPLLLKEKQNVKLIQANFADLASKLNEHKITKVNGILADLGVSSPQVDNGKRGFSYSHNGRLDMRMNQTQELDAYQIVNTWSFGELKRILQAYGNVPFAYKIASAILHNRPISSTLELVKIIKNSLPAFHLRKKNPSKAIFQALRIAVNNELENLKKMLFQAVNLLAPNGVLVVLTFHSLEDRIVKNTFASFVNDAIQDLPIIIEKKFQFQTCKPSKEEVLINKRSRSARLRALVKIRS